MINWRYVKGLNENSTGGSPLYTFLCFKNSDTTAANNIKFAYVPELRYGTTNSFPDNAGWGHIITQKATEQYIETLFWFQNNVKFSNNKALQWYKSDNATISSILYLSSDNYVHLAGGGNTIYIDNSANITGYMAATTYANIGGANVHETTGDLSAKNIYSDGNVNAGNNIIAGEKCEATYFNAISDSRAKTDLAPLSINALDLIKRVQLYSFKYKDSKLPSIGILAQDVKDVNIEGFKLVDNEEASGVDMDYMSIHESKLTYILWKAIQEQQKEIDELKAQIKSLIK